jgi:hypothetical protein
MRRKIKKLYIFDCVSELHLWQAFWQHQACQILTLYEVEVNFYWKIAGNSFMLNYEGGLCCEHICSRFEEGKGCATLYGVGARCFISDKCWKWWVQCRCKISNSNLVKVQDSASTVVASQMVHLLVKWPTVNRGNATYLYSDCCLKNGEKKKLKNPCAWIHSFCMYEHNHLWREPTSQSKENHRHPWLGRLNE